MVESKPFHAVRGGDTPSSHTVYFFGDGERLEITHHLPQLEGLREGRSQRLHLDGRQTGRPLRDKRVHGFLVAVFPQMS